MHNQSENHLSSNQCNSNPVGEIQETENSQIDLENAPGILPDYKTSEFTLKIKPMTLNIDGLPKKGKKTSFMNRRMSNTQSIQVVIPTKIN